MTIQNITEMLKGAGIPFAYDHFAEGESPDPPFICYLFPRSDNFAADGKAYFKINDLRIELYTDKKDKALEKLVEDMLDKRGQFYNKTEVWIAEERLYEVAYSLEVTDENEEVESDG